MTKLMDATLPHCSGRGTKQSETKQQHESSKFTLAIPKQEILCCYHANLKLHIDRNLEANSRLVVSLTLPKKKES
jgi:hypothetical protein